jgi:hypothetical protein
VDADPLFSILKKNGVSFYDVSKAIVEIEEEGPEEEGEYEFSSLEYGM